MFAEPVGRLNRRPTPRASRRQAKSTRAAKARVAVRLGPTSRTDHYPLLKKPARLWCSSRLPAGLGGRFQIPTILDAVRGHASGSLRTPKYNRGPHRFVAQRAPARVRVALSFGKETPA